MNSWPTKKHDHRCSNQNSFKSLSKSNSNSIIIGNFRKDVLKQSFYGGRVKQASSNKSLLVCFYIPFAFIVVTKSYWYRKILDLSRCKENVLRAGKLIWCYSIKYHFLFVSACSIFSVFCLMYWKPIFRRIFRAWHKKDRCLLVENCLINVSFLFWITDKQTHNWHTNSCILFYINKSVEFMHVHICKHCFQNNEKIKTIRLTMVTFT